MPYGAARPGLVDPVPCVIVFSMKQFHEENDGADGGRDPELTATAQLVVDTGVRLGRFVRRAVRSSPPSTLTISGIRALSYMTDNPGVCVSDLADYLLVGVPTASKLVDELVARELATRSTDERDRRRQVLRSTPQGERALSTAARPAQRKVAELLAELPPDERGLVRDGMGVLRELLLPDGTEASDG